MIGVIVPVYKNESQIESCIRSIINQSYSNYILYLVDDGSPDRSGVICDEYASKYSNIIVIHQKNQGVSAARNAGIDAATSDDEIEWITFIDGDDWIHRDYLKELLEICEHNNTDISISFFKKSDGTEFNEKKQFVSDVIFPDDIYSKYDSLVSPLTAWGKLFKKSVIGEIRFPTGKCHEDVFTVYKWLFSTDRISVLGKQLYYYYINNCGIMNSTWTPKRLDAIQGFTEQLVFLKNNGFTNSFNIVQYKLIRAVEYSIIASSGKKSTDSIIHRHIQTIKRELGNSFSNDVRKRFRLVSFPPLYRLKNLMTLFFESIKENGLHYSIKKIIGHFKK